MAFDPHAIRAQFPILATRPNGRDLHYLDNAATAQLPRAVMDAVARHEAESRANVARGVHTLAEHASIAFEDARAAVARFVNANGPDEVVFTAGTTSAINLAAHGVEALLQPGDEVVLSEAEHHSNIVPWQMLRDRRGIVLRVLPVTEDGRVDFTHFDRIVTKRCRLIAITHVSNVTGALTDIASAVDAARAVGAMVLLDGAQAVPHGRVDVRALGCDLYAFSGHKMFAPNGIGVLWGRRALLADMQPMMGGGGMIRHVSFERTTYGDPPKRFEAGTPPIAQAVGLCAAIAWMGALDHEGSAAHELRLTERMLSGLSAVPGTRIVGPLGLQGRRGVVSFAVDGVHPHDLCQWLNDRFGVALRGGHHCAEPLMHRFGLDGTSRASLAPYNTDADVDALLEGVADARRHLA